MIGVTALSPKKITPFKFELSGAYSLISEKNKKGMILRLAEAHLQLMGAGHKGVF